MTSVKPPTSRKRPILHHTNSLILLQKSQPRSISSSTLREFDLIPKELDNQANQNQALNEIDVNSKVPSSVPTPTTCIKRPPRKRPVQHPKNSSQVINLSSKNSPQITNRYIPQISSIPDCLIPGLITSNQNSPEIILSADHNSQPSPIIDLDITKATTTNPSPVNFINPSSKAIQLFPSYHDDWSSIVKIKNSSNYSTSDDVDHQINDFDSTPLPSIVLIPPSPDLDPKTIEETRKFEEVEENSLNENTTDSLNQVEENPNPEFSKEIAELLMGWSPWSYASLSKASTNQNENKETIHPIQTPQKVEEETPTETHKDKMRFQGFNIFKKTSQQEDKSTPTTPTTPTRRKLKKSRPTPKTKTKSKKDKEKKKNLCIRVVPDSQEEAESIIQSTYSNIISNTNFNSNDLFLDEISTRKPKLISLESAQQAQFCSSTDNRGIIGVAR